MKKNNIKIVFRERLLIVLLVLITLIFSGCRQDGIPVEKVIGTVTLDGKPATDFTVSFIAKDGKTRAAVGRTDNNGEFEMLTGGVNQNGVMPGDYYVTFSKYILVTPDGQEAKPFKFNPDGSAPPDQKLTKKYLVPLKYSDTEKPLFEAVVESGKINRYTFDLESN